MTSCQHPLRAFTCHWLGAVALLGLASGCAHPHHNQEGLQGLGYVGAHHKAPKASAIRIAAIRVSDDDGGRTARITPEQLRRWIIFSNRVFAPAGIEWTFDGQFSELNSSVINAADPSINWETFKKTAREEAKKHEGKAVIFFRWGPGKKATGQGFSGTDLDFVVMPGFDDDQHCGHEHIDALAHELGHFLALPHTFSRTFGTPEAAADFWVKNGNQRKVFDGDGLSDTLPDPSIHSLECTNRASIRLDKGQFYLPRKNIMSYYDERDSLSPQQIELARWMAEFRGQYGMRVPENVGHGGQEAEDLVAVSKKACRLQTNMRSFGVADWGNDAQWHCDGPLTLSLPVYESGRYRVVGYFTVAPDYGRIQFEIAGERLDATFDGWAPVVLPSGPIDLGEIELDEGRHHLRVIPAGASHGQLQKFGFDAIKLERIDVPDVQEAS